MCYFTFKYIEFLFYLILSKKDNNGRSSSTGLPLSPLRKPFIQKLSFFRILKIISISFSNDYIMKILNIIGVR